MDRLILARHGESAYSARGLGNGDPKIPVPLTERGRAQAAEMGRELRDEPIELCVTSEFPRVRETADIALAGRSIPRLVMPELNDIRYGDFEGESREIYQGFIREHGFSTPLPGGESKVEVARRVAAALRMLVERPERLILVVAHELPIGMVLRAVRNGVPVGEPDEIETATPYFLSVEEVERAAAILEVWQG